MAMAKLISKMAAITRAHSLTATLMESMVYSSTPMDHSKEAKSEKVHWKVEANS